MDNSVREHIRTIDVSGHGINDSNISTITADVLERNDGSSSTAASSHPKFFLRQEPPAARKLKKNPVWDYYAHFDMLYHPEFRNYRCCLICREHGIDKAIAVGKAASTGPMMNHLRQHNEQYNAFLMKKQEADSATESRDRHHTDGKTQLSIPSFATCRVSTNDCFQNSFAQWVVQQNQPLTVGESKTFVSMIRAANKTVTVPNYRKTYDLLLSKKTQSVKKLTAYLKKRYFAITCDHWTSAAQDNYGTLTLHLIDNFEMKTFVLSCKKHANGATAVEIESQLTTELQNWGLEKSFFLCAVTDTASNMNAFGERILQWEDSTLLRHHYCVDHVLQLTAVKAYSGEVERGALNLEDEEGEDNSVTVIKKARDLVTFFHSSAGATEKLRGAQRDLTPTSTPLKLLQDVKTRWWSTYTLVERIIQLKEVLLHIFQNEFRHREAQGTQTTLERLQLTERDFEQLENIAYVLKPFQEAQKALEGEKYVNLSLVPLVIHHLSEALGICEASINPGTQRDLRTLLENMQEDFHDRWGETIQYSANTVRTSRRRQKGIPTYAFWALALDPRTKRKVRKILSNEDETRLWNDIAMAIVRLDQHVDGQIDVEHDIETNDEAEKADENTQQQQQQSQTEQNKKRRLNFLADVDDDMDSISSQPRTIDELIMEEIAAYKLDRGQPMFTNEEYNDPLQWWREHETKYPYLWKLAGIILAIPATSAPSERVLSAAANIINKKRVQLKPETLDVMIFLRGNSDFVKWDKV